ncbi:MAG TPA: hypothetical protein VF190_14455 [Rhodothermales bacterium]
MSIRDISLTPRHSDHLRNTSVSETQTSATSEVKKQAQSAQAPESAKDRVEISEAGRKALAGSARSASEIEFARKALAEVPPLSDERIAQIRARLQEGFYLTKEAQDVVAAGLAATLANTREA